jgi:putative aldouronate transport system permease protein
MANQTHAAPLARRGVAGLRLSRQRIGPYLGRTWPLYLMFLPGLIALIVFHYYPMYGLVAAFQKFNPFLGFESSPWVGWENFERAFAQPSFWSILGNTVVIAVGKILSVQGFAVIFALLLNEVRLLFFKRAIQTLVYLPYFLSWIVLGGILIDMLGADGLVNEFLGAFGIGPLIFLGDNNLFQPTVIVSNIWKEGGWATIIYLAALTSIDPELYEASAIDGANRWKQTLHITLPGILATVLLIGALNLGNVLNAGFEQILALYNPVVYPSGDILDTWVYRTGLVAANYSLATAVGLLKSVVGLVLTGVAFWGIRRFSQYRVF